MRFSTAVAATAALVAGANAWGNSTGPVYTTEIVTAYTTYCPEATEITHGAQTYTVTEATTLTITNCPCTITKPVSSAVVTSCTSTPVPVVPVTSVAPVSSAAPVYSSAPWGNSTAPAYTPPPTGTGAYTAPVATFTGAANKAFAASGAGLAAVLGFAALL